MEKVWPFIYNLSCFRIRPNIKLITCEVCNRDRKNELLNLALVASKIIHYFEDLETPYTGDACRSKLCKCSKNLGQICIKIPSTN